MHFRPRSSTPKRRAYEMIMLVAAALGLYLWGWFNRKWQQLVRYIDNA